MMNRKSPMKWSTFYTYVFLPLVILYRFAYGWASIRMLFYPKVPDWLTPSIVLSIVDWLIASIFLAFIIYGLHKRRLWGWRLNWISIAGIALLTGIPPSAVWMLARHGNTDLTLLPVIWVPLTLLWCWPNFVYFKKRRHLFL